MLQSISEDTLDTLLAVAGYPYLDVVLVADSHPLVDKLRDGGATVALVEQDDRFVNLTARDTDGRMTHSYSLGYLGRNQVAPTEGEIEMMLQNVEAFDVFVTHLGLRVTSGRGSREERICNLNEFFSRVRLFGVAMGSFLIAPRFRTNEGFHYLYRMYHLFPEVQLAWTVVVACRGGNVIEGLMEQMSSLRTRLGFMCRAADDVCIACLRAPNNDSEDAARFSLGYLVMLSAAVLEDIAWILRFLYGLDQLSNRDTTLRLIGITKRHSELLKQLRNADASLHAFLAGGMASAVLISIIDIRDQLQHRDLPVGVGRINGRTDSFERGHVVLPDTAIRTLSSALTEPLTVENAHGRPGSVLVYPDQLARAIVSATAYLVNGSLSLARWSTLLSAATAGDRDRVKDNHDRFRKGVGTYLGWGVEPIVFPF